MKIGSFFLTITSKETSNFVKLKNTCTARILQFGDRAKTQQ